MGCCVSWSVDLHVSHMQRAYYILDVLCIQSLHIPVTIRHLTNVYVLSAETIGLFTMIYPYKD